MAPARPPYASPVRSDASTYIQFLLGNTHIGQAAAAAAPSGVGVGRRRRGVYSARRGGGTCRARTFSPLQGFAFHSPVGTNSPPYPPRSDVHTQIDSLEKKKGVPRSRGRRKSQINGVILCFFLAEASEGKSGSSRCC